ncbi:MAG: DUF871 domain-containing protein [Mycoplasmataceae bacterium]|nr:DUF871 domain-containing protein [Mycoplasmataceae bacterium]
MRKLGISIYPSHQDLAKMKKYVSEAHKNGFTRIFSSLLEISDIKNVDKSIKNYKLIFEYANELGFDICLDVNPNIFNILKISPHDLSFFNDLHVKTLRLDLPFDSKTESEMTYNKYGINIEVNMSNGTKYIDNILSYMPLKDRLISCHNFYPQRNCGLDLDFFKRISNDTKKLGIKTAAFVTSSNGVTGPWPISDGLPTLEMHRDLPITTQAKHLWATGYIDDVIIGNAFASDEELRELGKLNRYILELDVEFKPKTTKLEKEIVLDFDHFRRGDISGQIVRSTMSRVFYKNSKFPAHDNKNLLKKGDLVVCNDDLKNYKGEFQLLLQSSEKDERKNLVAKVVDEEKFLIDYIVPWSRFKFRNGGKNE